MKYSNYFIKMMLFAFVFLITSFVAFSAKESATSAIFAVATFITWFAGIMAPEEEKYN